MQKVKEKWEDDILIYLRLCNKEIFTTQKRMYICPKQNVVIMDKYTSWVGYLASAVLVISFIFTDTQFTLFLTLNSLGCLLFIIYGFLLGRNWPIIIPNVFILCLNLSKLWF
ncbi:hypothetical protein UJ101_00803 [Flavobacteriaceae bacterium UJ101]|nr:hypothetical protein UJ101_00803 [Flavobacteriaceae bacterium UJ101]